MKLRIRGNSLRFRLTQTEVQRLCADRLVVETIEFEPDAAQRLAYEVIASEEVDSITARFTEQRIQLLIPYVDAVAWGLDASQVGIAGGDSLQLLIEKDFACLKRSDGEDESDAYPNPNSNSVQC